MKIGREGVPPQRVSEIARKGYNSKERKNNSGRFWRGERQRGAHDAGRVDKYYIGICCLRSIFLMINADLLVVVAAAVNMLFLTISYKP
jgi:hypothetical protein